MFRARLIALMILLLMPLAPLQADWQTTRFVVYEGRPVDAPDWREQEEGEDDPDLNPALVREIENFLYATAKLYDNLGFADPGAAGFFDSVVQDDDGQDAIRVYLFHHAQAPAGWYSPGMPCAQPPTSRRVINLNAQRFEADETRIADANYQTIAHELFHAVQSASEFLRVRPCNRGNWITEGTADAMGYYAARKLRNLQFTREMEDIQFIKVVGARHYSIPLNEPPDTIDEAYATSSFWRYLAEVAWASANGKTHPGSKPAEENYAYLVELFNSPYPYGVGPASEITWLNERIKKSSRIPADLRTNFSQFVAVFADHIHTRIGPLGLVPNAAERESRWLDRAFSDCPFIGPVGDFEPARGGFNMAKNSARCFFTKVRPGTAGKGVRIEVSHDDKALLEQLRMGMMDGSLVSAPTIASKAGDQPLHIASWTFPVLFNTSMTFIVSNMAKQPAASRMFTMEFQLSIGNFITSNMGPQQPPPDPGSPNVGPQQPAGPTGASKPTRRELQKQQEKQAMEDPASHLAPRTKVERRSYQRSASCDPVDQQFNLCRSQLKITLELSPVAQQGNLLDPAQFMLQEGDMGVDFTGAGLTPKLIAAGRKTEQALESLDASKITISLPKLEYGFTGTVDNASIWVSKANGGKDDYISYGPTVQAGGRYIHQPPNGNVTIEEYQPMILRGSFSASLVDEADPGRDEAPIVARKISGQFLVPSPWQGDDDFAFDRGQVMEVMKQNMLQQTPFGTEAVDEAIEQVGAPPRELCEAGFDENEFLAMGFLQGCGTIAAVETLAPACTCDCEEREAEHLLDECERPCRVAWRECPLPAGSIPDDLEAQVAMYREYMTKMGVPEGMQKGLLDAFSKAPEYQRRMMLESYR